MIKIKDNTIEYTKGDTFDLVVDASSEFSEGDTLRLIIAESETAGPNIDNTYALSSDGVFILTFSEKDKQNLSIKPYIYKLILKDVNNRTVTQVSGDFIVKWGA